MLMWASGVILNKVPNRDGNGSLPDPPSPDEGSPLFMAVSANENPLGEGSTCAEGGSLHAAPWPQQPHMIRSLGAWPCIHLSACPRQADMAMHFAYGACLCMKSRVECMCLDCLCCLSCTRRRLACVGPGHDAPHCSWPCFLCWPGPRGVRCQHTTGLFCLWPDQAIYCFSATGLPRVDPSAALGTLVHVGSL